MKYNFDLDTNNNNSLSIIIKRVKQNSNILEFGPANGRLSKYLKESLNCKVYGVEIDANAAKDAKKYCEKIVVDDIENYTWSKEFRDIKFDYIIFADVLEHLKNPKDVLQKAKGLLETNGKILISVPNIAHNSIIMGLINDEFSYKKVGILDDTHLRFFSKKSLLEFIESCNLNINYLSATYATPEETEFEYCYNDFDDCISSSLKNREYGEVYQYIVEASTHKDSSNKVDLSRKYTASLYFSKTEGFSEKDKIVTEYSDSNDGSIHFKIEDGIGIKKIRIDPLEQAMSIEIKEIRIDENIYSGEVIHNGIYNKDEIIFLHNDPQIILDTSNYKSINSVTLTFKSLKKIFNASETVEKDSLKEELVRKDNYIDELKREINKLSNKMKNIGDELAYARSIVQKRDIQIESMRIKSRLKSLVKKFLPTKIIKKDDNKNSQNMKKKYIYKYPTLTEEIKDNIINFKYKPFFSIIMPVFNVDPKWLDLAIKSIEAQWYESWELCIADDKSTNEDTINYLKSLNNPKIKVRFLEKNLNISGASNKALELASGDYIVLMDNDDEITPYALYEVAKKINESDADFIYSDEDFVDTEGNYSNPHFKPDFSPDLLLSHNYITHLSAFKKSLLKRVGNFRDEFSGSQDYDLFLRITEVTNKIEHIPKVLYHWRTIETSTSINSDIKPEALKLGKQVVEDSITRRNINATVVNGNISHFFRVKYKIVNKPLVSIIIPFKDKPELLSMCINSILEKTTYQNYEIIGISNNSEEKETFETMKSLSANNPKVKFYEYNVEFNYANINNYAVKNYAKGEHILLLNNDIEVINPDWIEAMLEHSQREEIGCVGAKLYYPNDTIQHAGIIIGLGGYAGHSHKHFPRDNAGYFNRLMCVQNISAVTGACLMVKNRIYEELNGMDEVKFKVAYNDVDFCLRVREKGYLNIFTPYAELYHHESISRGYETTPEKLARFQKEKDALYERHKDILENGDPYYNPNLCHDKEDFSICVK